MNKTEIEQYLRRRYRLPQWALFFEVPDKIGADKTRRADAIAVSMNEEPCRILGFEIKAKRSDWLRELKDPEKSACFADKCNQFYIVAPSDVVQYEEVPKSYGWINPNAHWGRCSKRAEFFQRVDGQGKMEFLLVLLRRAALECEKFETIRQIVTSPVYDTRTFTYDTSTFIKDEEENDEQN
jgi:hypothetical protein